MEKTKLFVVVAVVLITTASFINFQSSWNYTNDNLNMNLGILNKSAIGSEEGGNYYWIVGDCAYIVLNPYYYQDGCHWTLYMYFMDQTCMYGGYFDCETVACDGTYNRGPYISGPIDCYGK
jgi:hypothetical protein